MSFSWYPGHMAKAVREIKPLLKLIDIILEVVDARSPYASSNPLLAELAPNKPRIVLLNKADLADSSMLKVALEAMRSNGVKAFPTNSESGEGVEAARRAITAAGAGARIKARALIVGMPNVGKSSLINRLAGRARARTGDKPGITRGRQWIDIGQAELLDTPGIMPLRVDDSASWVKLCAIGIISDDLFDSEQVATALMEHISRVYPGTLEEKYSLDSNARNIAAEGLLASIAARKGCLLKGGTPDTKKAAFLLIKDFRAGKLGRISLEG